MRTTIPVMTPPQYNDFHVGRVFAVAVPGDGPVNHHVALRSDLATDICACRRCHSDVRLVLI